ncbi:MULTISPECIES: hypothetical protein [unclassified Cedecea]|uniref:hypothetical protein n=1 Tax=unclassified Cedecea TaxID=2649846 RepID=UPI003016E20A
MIEDDLSSKTVRDTKMAQSISARRIDTITGFELFCANFLPHACPIGKDDKKPAEAGLVW